MTGRLLLILTAVLAMAFAPGCGGGAKAPAAAKPDSAQVGAVCDTTLDTTAVAGTVVQSGTEEPKAVKPESPKPKTETKAAGQPKELPKMWDFGSVSCQPCKTMKEILDPMIADYRDKVDIRILNVYEEKELARQFRIISIPTQVFIDASGKELYRHIGVYPRDSIESCFKKFAFPIVSGSSAPTQPPATGGT